MLILESINFHFHHRNLKCIQLLGFFLLKPNCISFKHSQLSHIMSLVVSHYCVCPTQRVIRRNNSLKGNFKLYSTKCYARECSFMRVSIELYSNIYARILGKHLWIIIKHLNSNSATKRNVNIKRGFVRSSEYLNK